MRISCTCSVMADRLPSGGCHPRAAPCTHPPASRFGAESRPSFAWSAAAAIRNKGIQKPAHSGFPPETGPESFDFQGFLKFVYFLTPMWVYRPQNTDGALCHSVELVCRANKPQRSLFNRHYLTALVISMPASGRSRKQRTLRSVNVLHAAWNPSERRITNLLNAHINRSRRRSRKKSSKWQTSGSKT